jgi:hypothetical protein
VRKYLAIIGLLLISVTAHAVETKPKHVFIRSDCDGTLGSEIVTSLRDAIRASPGYQLASSLTDDGGYDVVLTIYVECSESALPTGERIASVASIFGTATCTLGSCTVASNESTLEASLCSGTSGTRCGKDLYTTLDGYMSKSGEYLFDRLSESRQKALLK